MYNVKFLMNFFLMMVYSYYMEIRVYKNNEDVGF